MQLTITVSNAAEARDAQALLARVIEILEPPAPAIPPGMSVLDLGLSSRAANCLLAQNINTVDELVCYSLPELTRWPNLGRVSGAEISKALAQRGLTLGMRRRSHG